MLIQTAARVRFFANLLTACLALYGAWGWIMDPTLSLIDRLAAAAIALIAQQMANLAAACAAVAAARRQRVAVAVAVGLMLVFAGISGHAIEHTLDRPIAAREAALRAERDAARDRLDAEVRAAAEERRVAEAALRELPSDIPTRRIQALQAPINAALARGEARVAQLARERAALDTPIAPTIDAKAMVFSLLFWLLAFCEPLFYWLLAALRDETAVPPGCPAVPTHIGTPAHRRPASSRNPWGRLAMAVGLTTAWAAHAEARDSALHSAAFQQLAGTQGARAGDAAAGNATHAPRTDAALLTAARDLQERGYSIRRIATALGQCSKSTIHRMLQRASGSSPPRAPAGGRS